MARGADVQKLRRHQQVLVELAQLAAQKLPSESLLDGVVARVARGVEIDHVKIMRYRPEHGDLLAEAGVGWRPGVVGQATFGTELTSPPGRAFQTGQPVVIPDVAATDEFRVSMVLREHGIKSVLNVPVLIEGAAWGVLEVDSSVERDFSIDTLDFMLTTAAIVASAIRREHVDRAQEEAIAEAARETRRQQVLLHEMQHRMKNNFQIILSMISIQAGRLPADRSRAVLDKLADGIMAMSLAHDQLSAAQGLSIVNLPIYLRALTTSIQKPLDTVTVEVQADEISVPISQAVSIGLIVNELVTNSVKHAFGDGRGAVRIELAPGPAGREIHLKVSDNGVGIDPARPPGAGFRLVEALARQIRGRIERSSSKTGTTTSIVFSLR